jgi:MFS family permease
MGRHPAVFLGGAMLFGTYTGAFCFYMVFHSLVHPERAGRYVAVNEALVGITGFLAPLAGGLMADAWGFRWPYLCAAGLMLVATAVQVRVTRAAS